MKQDEIIRFAIQCHLVTTDNRDGYYMDALTEFAKLVAAKEREACAKLCDELSDKHTWEGLTDEEANLLWENTDDRDSWELIKRVEAKLKQKNT